MGKHIERITYKGKEILFLDISGSNEEERLAAWEEARQLLLRQQHGRLSLVNVQNITLAPRSMKKAKEAAEAAKAQRGHRIAFVGLTGLQKSTAEIALRSMGVRAHFCSTLEQGKEWLVKEDDEPQH